MIFAKQEHIDELVCAINFKQNNKYFCPGCGERVVFKEGPQKQAHFAHFKKSCHFFSEGETKKHVTGKNLIKMWAEKRHKRADIEQYLPKLKQRPDVLINLKNSQLVVEYQCSPLTLKDFNKRTDGYKQNGYRIFWILGMKHRLNKKLTQQQAMFINFHKNIGYFLVFIDTERQCLILNYELCFENLYGIRYCTRIFNDASDLMKFIKYNCRNKTLNLSQADLFRQLTKLEKNCYYLNHYLKQQIDFCYMQRYYFMGFPICCLSQTRLPPIYRHEDIFWRIRVILDLQKYSTDVITKKELEILFELQQKSTETFFEMPLVGHLAIKQANNAYINSLVKNHILIPIKESENYRIDDYIVWTNDISLKKENLQLCHTFISNFD